jgi:hypothetical protein
MALSIGAGVSIGDGINVGVPYITATAGNTTSVVVQQNTAITSFNSFSSVVDGRSPYTYYVSVGTLPPGITIASGNGLVSGTPNTIQSAANVTFSVRDVNNDVATTTSTVSFAVTGMPISAVAGNTTPLSTQQNTAITSFNSFASVSNGTVPYTYYVSSGTLPPGITINSGNGLVSGTPNTVQSAANVTFSVKDVNNVVATTTTTKSFEVTVIPISAVAGNVRTISTQQNSAISSFSSFASVSDGTVPYTYYVSAGTLPPGITIASGNGLVSGTPNTVQSAANVTFSVRDVNNVVAGNTSVTSFAVTVIPISAVAGNTTPLSTQQNTAISSFSSFSSVSNGTLPYTYYVSSGTLPPGITLASGNGLVSGTPNTVQSAANVTFSVRDVNNVVASTTTTRSFEVTVIPISAVAGSTTTVSATQNSAITSFNAFTSVSNGTTPYTYYVSTGTLPTGIIINSSTGQVSGTPNTVQSAANVTFSVKDVNNVVASTTTTTSFTVTSASSPYSIQYFVLAGGGGGGGSCFVGYGAGGGGAGGVLQGSATVSPGTPYTINVGAGGTGGANPVSPTTGGGSGLGSGSPGGSSNITGAGFTTITTVGGGAGGGGGGQPAYTTLSPGKPGGSGGGVGQIFTGATATAGSGTPGQGFPGGTGGSSASGSGGGAGGAGFTRTPTGSPSGAGVAWPYQGTTYASGGGWGGFGNGSVAPGGGGLGGSPLSPYNGSPGSPGTGGGGGGGGRSPGPGTPTTRGTGGLGGGGRIMIAVPNAAYPTVSAPGAAVSTPGSAPGLTVLTWTTSSTFTA